MKLEKQLVNGSVQTEQKRNFCEATIGMLFSYAAIDRGDILNDLSQGELMCLNIQSL